MSVSSCLKIRFEPNQRPTNVLAALLASEWKGQRGEHWCLPPEGDASDWTLVADADHDALLKLLAERNGRGEPFGIRLGWRKTNIGGEFLLFPTCDLLFSPTINRVLVGPRMSDVSWYVSRLVPVFAKPARCMVESWSWEETP